MRSAYGKFIAVILVGTATLLTQIGGTFIWIGAGLLSRSHQPGVGWFGVPF